ncbi:hypothetical protein AXX04_01760 [Pseudomonas aeruginosa]|nr:hypothetical protein AN455_16185 [Pseudomonas aeruginosa]KRV12934.1 hypothetical protein AN456_28855 [Pseudomonas aeruginosa]RIZ38804.1 hypothetical protein AXX04_01760 [Pseudomonas aeruginosa]
MFFEEVNQLIEITGTSVKRLDTYHLFFQFFVIPPELQSHQFLLLVYNNSWEFAPAIGIMMKSRMHFLKAF